MKTLPVVGYDSVAKEHRPLVVGSETIPAGNLPFSAFPGNGIVIKDDGLYVGGSTLSPLLYVDGVAGVDGALNADGSPSTLKTLDYALSLIEASKPETITLLLKSGQVFPLTQTRKLTGTNLILSYYDDPKYGLAGVRYLTSKIWPQIQTDLSRPKITSTQFMTPDGYWSCRHIRLAGGSLSSVGVNWDIPNLPEGTLNLQLVQYSAESDLIISEGATVNIEGTIINKPEALNYCGFLGVASRGRTTFSQYASKFLIENKEINESVTRVDLIKSRPYFIKFYPDIPTDDTFTRPWPLIPSSVESTDGCGLLTLMWLLCSSTPDAVTGSTSVGTFPLADYNYGVAKYIHGIRRDQQNRPLNITSSILI